MNPFSLRAQVEILSEGDFVNELLILVGGMVEVLRPGADGAEELPLSLDGHSSLRGTCIRRALLGSGGE